MSARVHRGDWVGTGWRYGFHYMVLVAISRCDVGGHIDREPNA